MWAFNLNNFSEVKLVKKRKILKNVLFIQFQHKKNKFWNKVKVKILILELKMFEDFKQNITDRLKLAFVLSRITPNGTGLVNTILWTPQKELEAGFFGEWELESEGEIPFEAKGLGVQ